MVEQYTDIVNKLEIIGDPYDVNMHIKKTHALHHFYAFLKVSEND